MASSNVAVLLIGSTGHIGGAALNELVKTYPSIIDITAVVRSEKDLDILEKQYDGYANVKFVTGDLKDPERMEKLASNATIVLNCGPDTNNDAAISALLRGLAAQDKPAYYVSTSGADIIWDAPTGEVEGRVWDDVAHIEELLALAQAARASNRLVAAANTAFLRTAVVAPCWVMGASPSSATHPTPLTFPDLLYIVKALDAGFTIAKGVNRASFVDVRELGRLYAALVGDALRRLLAAGEHQQEGARDETETEEEAEAWGPKAYYFGENMEASMREFMRDHLVPALRASGDAAAYPSTDEIKEITIDVALDAVLGRLGEGAKASSNRWRVLVYGANMRARGTRAQKALGFEWSRGGDAGIAEGVRAFVSKP
ncbi:hypothetical protein F4778DRAFT_737687 [Xylariomycetidae sp. FL2044]|nr:hypothetical protein F4778DRAFT_767354 [Xylariomycetidae sp. FL2044]KAH9901792.1 hypothetical protein F4778DRAFT_737687 [Xylariomycetidae sp. FL2044]